MVGLCGPAWRFVYPDVIKTLLKTCLVLSIITLLDRKRQVVVSAGSGSFQTVPETCQLAFSSPLLS